MSSRRAFHAPPVKVSSAEHSMKRDVRADFPKPFGGHVRSIDVVAVMTDTDNSGGNAVACYGEIRFASE